MTQTVLFAAGEARWPSYEPHLRAAFDAAGLDARLVTSCPADQADYIVFAPGGDIADFAPYTRCKAVLSLWAGVEKIVGNATLTQPLCRMVDPALTAGMVEWVAGHVLRHHLGMDRHIVNPARDWNPEPPPLAAERPVTILGLGELGRACGQALAALGFPVTGWSRSPRTVQGLACLSGDDGLRQALDSAQILVTLLPATPETDSLINAERLASLRRGAVILNPGRGTLIDDAALLAALDTGQVGHATLDVFRVEPLPQDHPFWAHPKVTVTPHIAAETRPSSASRIIAENIRRSEAGEPLLFRVDRARGY